MDEDKPTVVLRPHATPAGSAPTMPGAGAPVGVPPAMPAMTHGELPDRYDVAEEIARGGMGRVVEATDTMLGRVVAVKQALANDADAIRRFQRETKITARLEHPSIVPVYDAGVGANGAPFYVMRKVSGRPLEQFVRDADSLDKSLALLPHVVAAANAVAHAHGRGVIHRDIKPANILVGDLGETIVIDWGLAKVVDDPDDLDLPLKMIAPTVPVSSSGSIALPGDDVAPMTRVGIVYGTPGFMAPEQLSAGQPDPRWDVYALGATLYYMLAHHAPHDDAKGDILEAAVSGPPTPIATRVPGVPPELATIIDTAVAFDEAARYPNARVLAEELTRFLAGKLVGAHHYTAAQKLARFIRQHRGTVIAASVAIVALVVVGAIAVRRIVAERDVAQTERRIVFDEKRDVEAARAAEQARGDELTVFQARELLDTNPTEAAALIKPLARSHWQSARAVAAGVRAAGAAWGVPASATTSSLELSRDGTKALAAGGDGAIRLVDLAARTSRVIATLDGRFATFVSNETAIAAYRDTDLAIIDLDSGVRTDVTVPTPIAARTLVWSRGSLLWRDAGDNVWRLEPGKTPVDQKIKSCRIAPSPDGRWIVYGVETGVSIVDVDHPEPHVVPGHSCGGAVWTPDSSGFAFVLDGDLVTYTTTPALARIAREPFRPVPLDVAPRSMMPGPIGRAELGAGYPVLTARGDAIVSLEHGVVQVRSPDGDVPLHSPVRVDLVIASPASAFVVGAVAGALVTWNLDDVLPRRLAMDAPERLSWVGTHQLIAAPANGHGHWFDLADGSDVAVDIGDATIVAPPSGDRAVVIATSGVARLVRRGGQLKPIADDVKFAEFIDGRRFVYGTTTGELWLVDDAALPARLAEASWGKLVGLHANGAWIAAAYDDGTLWRYDLGKRTQTTFAGTAAAARTMVLRRDCVLYAVAEHVRCWDVDGSQHELTAVPQPIARLSRLGRDFIAAETQTGGVYQIDLTDPDNPGVSPLPPSIEPNGSMATIQLARAGTDIAVVDLVSTIQWTIARPGDRTFGEPRVAPDGGHVAAAGDDGVLVWSTEMPESADDAVRWLDAETNARLAGAALVWQ
ncbi:MAG TPA: serine/threonine-protein kinase [Kofleriaceae bacterium]|nr:serine/threonine-protein kinase [Kofleriaceae bacterium]